MATTTYIPVGQPDSSFDQPRQKKWIVFQQGMGWSPQLITGSYIEAINKVKELINKGVALNKIVLAELVPLDTALIPTV